MGLTFRKGIKLGPVRVNLSGSGIGYSVGVKGLRVVKTAKGRTYMNAQHGPVRFQQTIPTKQASAAKGPWAPSKYINLDGGEEFWLDMEGEENEGAQVAIAAAVEKAGDAGAKEPIIEIALAFFPGSGIVGIVDNDKAVGVLPESDPRFKALAAALVTADAAGTCLALVFDENGKLGLKLNLDREALASDSVPDRKPPTIPAGLVVGGVLSVFAGVLKGLFGRRR